MVDLTIPYNLGSDSDVIKDFVIPEGVINLTVNSMIDYGPLIFQLPASLKTLTLENTNVEIYPVAQDHVLSFDPLPSEVRKYWFSLYTTQDPGFQVILKDCFLDCDPDDRNKLPSWLEIINCQWGDKEYSD